MFPYTVALMFHEQRATELRAEAAQARLAHAVRQAGSHRRSGWWSRLTGRDVATTRAPVHP